MALALKRRIRFRSTKGGERIRGLGLFVAEIGWALRVCAGTGTAIVVGVGVRYRVSCVVRMSAGCVVCGDGSVPLLCPVELYVLLEVGWIAFLIASEIYLHCCCVPWCLVQVRAECGWLANLTRITK